MGIPVGTLVVVGLSVGVEEVDVSLGPFDGLALNDGTELGISVWGNAVGISVGVSIGGGVVGLAVTGDSLGLAVGVIVGVVVGVLLGAPMLDEMIAPSTLTRNRLGSAPPAEFVK